MSRTPPGDVKLRLQSVSVLSTVLKGKSTLSLGALAPPALQEAVLLWIAAALL